MPYRLQIILAMGYLTFLQVALVFLAALPFHILHRFVVGSLLTAVVSGAVSGMLLSIWMPFLLSSWLEIKFLHMLGAGVDTWAQGNLCGTEEGTWQGVQGERGGEGGGSVRKAHRPWQGS